MLRGDGERAFNWHITLVYFRDWKIKTFLQLWYAQSFFCNKFLLLKFIISFKILDTFIGWSKEDTHYYASCLWHGHDEEWRNKIFQLGISLYLLEKAYTLCVNPFVPDAPFLYPLKTSENRKVLYKTLCLPSKQLCSNVAIETQI